MQVRELGHVVLYVRDLERSRRFYRDVLGFTEIGAFGTVGAAFSSGRAHHELLLLEVGPEAAPLPSGPRIGLYHIGLKIGEDDDDLREAAARLREAGVPIAGAADHHVTHSLYLADPDGNEIELFVDVLPREVWSRHPELIMRTPRPLSL